MNASLYSILKCVIFSLAVFSASFYWGVEEAEAGEVREAYANVEVRVPEGYRMSQMQTFSGAVPSRAWLFERDGKEVLVSVLNTDGIRDGMHDQDPERLAKLYLDGLVTGWGGHVDTEEPKRITMMCGAEAEANTVGVFGGKTYDYYACLLRSPRLDRLALIVVWANHGVPVSEVGDGLKSFLNQIRFAEKRGME